MIHAANTNLLFVYGSLKCCYAHEMHQQLRTFASFVEEGMFQGKLYRIDWYPGVVASEDPRDQVSGEIYHIADSRRLFRVLDAYEGFDPAKPEESEYLRVISPVQKSDGNVLPCHLYLYNWPLENAQRIESGVF